MITRQELSNIAGNGVWKQNTSIVQILGLCPLLAVTTNAVNGIMLSLATIVVMAMSNVAVASLRNFIEATQENPFFQIGEAKYGKPILDRVITPVTCTSSPSMSSGITRTFP